ncbi:MAG TPA: Ig-like domain-containing protein [Gemmatimonadaceae bacterium]|nr:Ig-like domain-containing protein [Gemmatimonadaceae bacterium]
MLTRPQHAWRRVSLPVVVAAWLSGTACTTATDPLPAASVRIVPGDPVRVVRINQSISLSAQCLNARGEVIPGHAVSWFTSNPLVASVDNDGDVVGLDVGQSTISANCGGVAAQVQVQVTLVPVSSVSITPDPLSLFVGDVQQLATTVLDSASNQLSLQGRQVIWSSDNLPVASVSGSGVVQGVSQGTANVRVTVDGVVSPAIVVTVQRVPVASVTILPLNPPSLKVGQLLQLTALMRDGNGNQLSNRAVTWASLDETKATVGATTGVVTGVAPGTVTIQATSEGVIGSTVLTIIP